MTTLANKLQPFVDSGTLAGAVLLAAGPDKIHALEAVGYSDIAAKTPMRTDSFFWIASVSKPLTATAFMMLVDEGKVNLDDPVAKYLPQYNGQMVAVEADDDHVLLKKPKSAMTVKQLLSHTSGLPFTSRLTWKIDDLTMRECIISYAMSPLKSEPGTKYDYSNAGINTAGRIIEVVSGLSYAEFMDQRLLQPLGLTETTLWPTPAQLARLAKAYQPNAAKAGLEETSIGQCTYPLDNLARHPSPGGGYFSTASDVAVFGQMILNGGIHKGRRYLSEAAVAQMTSRHTGQLEANYGLGWGTAPPAGFGHGGALGNHLWINPAEQLLTVYMIQHAGFPGTDGPKISPAFTEAASAAFGKKQ